MKAGKLGTEPWVRGSDNQKETFGGGIRDV